MSILESIAVLQKKSRKIGKKKKYKIYGVRNAQQIARAIRCTHLRNHHLLPYILMSMLIEPYWRNLMAAQFLRHILYEGCNPQRIVDMMQRFQSGDLQPEIYVQSLSLPARILPLGTAFPELAIPLYLPRSKTFTVPPYVLYALCLFVEKTPFLTMTNVFPTTYLMCHLAPEFALSRRHSTAIGIAMGVSLWRGVADIASTGQTTQWKVMAAVAEAFHKEIVRMENM